MQAIITAPVKRIENNHPSMPSHGGIRTVSPSVQSPVLSALQSSNQSPSVVVPSASGVAGITSQQPATVSDDQFLQQTANNMLSGQLNTLKKETEKMKRVIVMNEAAINEQALKLFGL